MLTRRVEHAHSMVLSAGLDEHAGGLDADGALASRAVRRWAASLESEDEGGLPNRRPPSGGDGHGGVDAFGGHGVAVRVARLVFRNRPENWPSAGRRCAESDDRRTCRARSAERGVRGSTL